MQSSLFLSYFISIVNIWELSSHLAMIDPGQLSSFMSPAAKFTVQGILNLVTTSIEKLSGSQAIIVLPASCKPASLLSWGRFAVRGGRQKGPLTPSPNSYFKTYNLSKFRKTWCAHRLPIWFHQCVIPCWTFKLCSD